MELNLTTTYLGLELRNPLIASAGPLTSTADGIHALADAGAGAVVLPSVFEERLRRQPGAWPHEQLRVLEKAAGTVGIPVIASLNGVTPGGWTQYAGALQEAGAAAIELNVYHLPGDPGVPARAAELGSWYAELLRRVKRAVEVPVAVKMTPYSGAPGETAVALDRAGADGLVLFNRFLQLDIDPEALTVSAGFGLSSPGEATLPRTWIRRLRGDVRCSLAASTGVETAADVAAYLLAGADAVMTTSALLRHGPGYAADLLDGLRDWMRRKGFPSVAQAGGLLATQASELAAGRASYVSAVDQTTARFSARGGG